MKKAVVLINDTTYAFNLRGAIFKELVYQQFEVVVIGKLLKHVDKLEQIGCRLIEAETNRNHINPVSDLALFRKYLHVLKVEKPDIVLTYNIKPNIYGGLACQIQHIPYLANITGLGTPLGNNKALGNIACRLYKAGIKNASCVFFQNESNYQFFLEHSMIGKHNKNVRLLPGSGVDLSIYSYLSYPEGNETHFLFAARIIKEKGIDLVLSVAEKFADEHIIFDICGNCEDKDYLAALTDSPFIRYHGEQDNMQSFYQECSCFLFPSYYPEGMSNVLLEAAASGRPIITTNQPGCKEIVEDKVSGFLVPPNDLDSLCEAVEHFLNLSFQERQAMGMRGRKLAESKFDRKIVVDMYLDEIQQIFMN